MFILCLVRGKEGERVKQRCCQEGMKNCVLLKANGLSEREFLMIDISTVYQRSVSVMSNLTPKSLNKLKRSKS